jgi:hypothetical protein
MVVATMRHLPDVSSKVLCLIDNFNEETISETIAYAFRDTAPNFIRDDVIVKVDRVNSDMFVLVHYTDDNDGILTEPRSVLVTLSSPPIYGKD